MSGRMPYAPASPYASEMDRAPTTSARGGAGAGAEPQPQQQHQQQQHQHPQHFQSSPRGSSAEPSDATSNGGATSLPPSVEFLGDSVIPIVNKLQDIFAQLGTAGTIDLPQVAVVGSQSSGKSSVLESLVGRDFLPRGSDVVTRRPLVLQLVQVPRRPDGRAEEWGEFLHLPGKRFTDFSAIREEIQVETERETGHNKGISEKQIRLKIFSPHVLTITLVDLPGITKVPVGDQPGDIEARVRTMILSYIKHETCVILAVSPANADLANSDALQMARIADPDGHRTIGVITKLDIMDRGTDARNFLLGSVIPLRLGYVGVINRSQEDIVSNKTVKDALAYEESFFRSRPVYHSLADRCGVAQLAKKLNTILVQHIRALLPDLKARINAQMVTLQKELASYGEAVDKATMGMVLLSVLTKYSQAYTTIVDGKNQGMSTTELSGGARIHYIFQSIFVKSLNDVDPCDDLTDDDIRTALQNATGTKNALFVPEVPFEVLVRRQIARLLDPSLQCARFVYDELVKISHRCEPYELTRFPVLRRRVEETVGGFLREGLAPAETMIGHIISMEMDYINTSHPSFVGGSKAVEMALQQQRTKRDVSDREPSAAERATGSGASSSSSSSASSTPSRDAKARGLLARKDGISAAAGVPDGAATRGGSGAAAPGQAEQPRQGVSWGISSIFGGPSEQQRPRGQAAGAASAASGLAGMSLSSQYPGDMLAQEPPVSILLKEPPAVLRASEHRSSEDSVEISVTRLLVKSYYDIVRKNIQDAVPKAIMHFLVNQSKRELHSVFIQQLYREGQFEEMLQEKEEVAEKRQRCKDIFRVLQQAAWTLEELPLDPDAPHRQVGSSLDATGLPTNSPYAVVANAAAMSTNLEMSLASNPYASSALQAGMSGAYRPQGHHTAHDASALRRMNGM